MANDALSLFDTRLAFPAMSKFIAPSPILDGREEQRLISLTADYQKFIAPGRISKAIGRARDAIVQITPEKFKKLSGDAFNAASEHAVIQKAMAVAGKGLGVLGNQSAQRLVVSAEGVVQTLSRPEHPLTSYRHVCGLRSYTIEEIVNSKGSNTVPSLFLREASPAHLAW